MEFEYNLNKSKSNKAKHGVDFEEAKSIWLEDHIILPAITRGEKRFMIIGRIGASLFSCVFTIRKNNIRIISSRKSRKNERRIFYEKVA